MIENTPITIDMGKEAKWRKIKKGREQGTQTYHKGDTYAEKN